MKNVYILLGLSIILEVIGATFMKYTSGFENTTASLVVILSYLLALTLYIMITKNHELGMINALWSGGGTALVTIIGIILFGETTSFQKLAGVALILAGIYGLNTRGRSMKGVHS
ncbi:DMT family transporter [Halobacillus halophilus]|uniref:DMT family transporter n=1 Tax=Halobacillus halophilus TaxID=1570 RepID=UPI001CD20E3E|nr:multidrug efflux SMR transporter [Halobacillus halophilus]MCA1011562.1 multidrug efflux SMR transporter [Halobacillus halophilus]